MSPLPPRSALIISITPPIPRDYGNRNRVFQTTKFIRSLGYRIFFLLYPFDRDWAEQIPPYYRELVDQFDFFSVIPNSKPLHRQAADQFHEIDEWWDETIERELIWLFERNSFDLILVNYTFLSKAFEFAPSTTLRLLDTHDMFSGRRELFEAYGVKPEFFYTTHERETVAFRRAHAVLAIKDSEARLIHNMHGGKTFCLPYFDDRARSEPRTDERIFDYSRPLKLGFIGAENSVNLVNLLLFLKVFSRYALLYDPPVELIVAGDVCRGLDVEYPFLRKLGRIVSVSEFYAEIDAAIVPFEFSTGIKIKVGEALAHGVPVLATRNAFDGYREFHRSQAEPTLHALANRVIEVAFGETPFRDLDNATFKSARAGLRAQQRGFDEIASWLRESSQRLFVVVDRPFWYRATFVDECIAQTVEFLSHIGHVVLCCVTAEAPNMRGVYAKLDCISVADVNAIPTVADELESRYRISSVIQLIVDEATARTCNKAISGVSVPRWTLSIREDGVNSGFEFHERVGGSILPVSGLKYRPMKSSDFSGTTPVVVLYRPANCSAWQSLASRYVCLQAADTGYEVKIINVPAYYEYSQSFFESVTHEITSKAIALVDDTFWGAMLEDLYAQTDARLMLLHADFCVPESVVDGEFSLEVSIRDFLLHKTIAAPATTGAGWDGVWDAIAATLV